MRKIILMAAALALVAGEAHATIPGRGLVEAARDFFEGFTKGGRNNSLSRRYTEEAYRGGSNAGGGLGSNSNGFGGTLGSGRDSGSD